MRTPATVGIGLALVSIPVGLAFIRGGTDSARSDDSERPSDSTPGVVEPRRIDALPVALRSEARPAPASLIREGVGWEQTILDLRPIFEALPHLPESDWHKLGYYCRADFDKNDRIGEEDLALFLAAWSDADHALASWTDVNGDGVLDSTDVYEFLEMYSSGECDTEARRALREIIC